RQEAGGRRQEAGGRRQEAGGRRQEAGGRRQEAGGRRQKAGDRRQTSMNFHFTTKDENSGVSASPRPRVSASPRLFSDEEGIKLTTQAFSPFFTLWVIFILMHYQGAK
ncbi:MAG: hypothetical protein F6K41_33365, partial [Symploca sp. SIO3E6]|nr:hypothetical protein [Caldora sp. SIO3E6]